ncbi:ACP S-malonyltransferase [Haliangium sp.]|uniref:ACP S-malonyltransferase n=1 Tax=Haliangium sp. TaxID=2663208 RepID=UPI003D0DB57B
MSTALLFPGQGSQSVGMGRALVDAFPAARAVFEEADDALGFSISEICFDGPMDRLTLTEFGQPAILTNSVAVLRALQAEVELDVTVTMGHSLGEYSALVAAGALSLADAVRLVHLRGQAMQEAVPVGEGSMAALLGLDLDAVLGLCAEVCAEGDWVLAPANLNGGGQVVISGHTVAIERALAVAKDKGAKRAVPLKVSAPFHSPLMQPAADRVAAALDQISLGAMSVPVISNVEAAPYQDSARVKELLVAQVTGTVRWEESMQALAGAGVSQALELGAGSVLRGLARRIVKDLPVHSLGEPEHIQSWSK